MLLFRNRYPDGVPLGSHLFAEGIGVTLFGTGFAWWLFPDEVSLIAVFLASITTADSIERVLEGNRVAIFDRKEQPFRANLRLSNKLLMMFLGCVAGFSILSLALPLEMVEKLFSHQLLASANQRFPILHFGNVGGLLLNNLYVLLFFFAIALPFRQGGVMLAIAWNASVWGSTFAVLARRWSMENGPPLVEAWVRVMAACGTHMALEAAAYTLAGLAGVFLSKAFYKHAFDSDPMISLLGSIGVMLGIALLSVLVGALWEALVAYHLVAWVS